MDVVGRQSISRRALARILSQFSASWIAIGPYLPMRVKPGSNLFAAPHDDRAQAGSLGDDVTSFHVKTYGAKVDGRSDDLEAYNATLSACAASGGGIVDIGPGTMLISKLPTYPTGVPIRIRGAGRFRTIVRHKTGGALVDWTANHRVGEFGCGFEDLTFDGGNTASTVVTLTNHTLFQMTRVTISAGAAPGTGTGLSIVSLFDSQFTDIYVTDCGDPTHPCVILDSVRSTGDSCNNVHFYGLHVEPTNCDAIYLDIRGNAENGVDENKFWGLKLHGNPKSGNPGRALLNLSQYAFSNEFDSPIFAFGKGTAQVICDGRRNVFRGGAYGIGGLGTPFYAIQCTSNASHNVWESPNFKTPKLYRHPNAVFRGEAGSLHNKLLFPRSDFSGAPPYSEAGRNCAVWDDTSTNTGLQVYHADGIATGFPPGLAQTAEYINDLTDAPTILTNAALGNAFTVTLGGNRRMDSPTNARSGQTITYEIIQDTTGGWRLGWHAVFKTAWSDTRNGANSRSLISFRYNGSNWVQCGAQGPYV